MAPPCFEFQILSMEKKEVNEKKLP
ncbi:unknown protein [Parachlamydia acanthamoebae UV-7]|uniref:Uncharacterized protein n=1 Tax=Parachlamydia acanthamoebae (strain UV7) TaxID=765952 RepID=F8KYW6_PARAV|nr:unknown protein [Parachlamydia acanthamoebae UV-7]